MPHVVALKLEARAAVLAQHLQDVLDVAEGVAKDQVFHSLDVGLLPGVAPVVDLASRRVDGEVHRAHVE
ncbi:hypothetical protein D3C71_2102230 [compost metagenome]